MKKYMIVLAGILIFGQANAQLDLPGSQTTSNIILKSIEALNIQNIAIQSVVENRISKLVDKASVATAVNFLRDVESLRRINALLESFYCQTSETSLLISIGGTNCLLNMNLELALLNVTYSQDLLKTVFVVSSVLFMEETSGDSRMRMLENVAQALEKSITIFRNLNQGLSLRLEKVLLDQYLNGQVARDAKYMSRNRYN